MSTLLPLPPRGRAARSAFTLSAQLTDDERPELMALVESDPVVNCVLAARLESTASLRPRVVGGRTIGLRDRTGTLVAAAFHGGSLLTVGGGAAEWAVIGDHLADTPRTCTSIIGRADAVAALWPRVATAWGSARAVRVAQPLLVGDAGGLTHLAGDPRVRAMRRDDLDRYLPAAAAMFSEELGVAPSGWARPGDYRRRIESLIAEGRAFGIVDVPPAGIGPQVQFKADIAAVSSRTSQIQGVWVRPELRGHGLASAAMVPVLRHALGLAPTVSLYVNDYNEPARRLYARLGMREIATLSTVLF